MAKLPQVSGAEVLRRLKRLGMEDDHQRGGHVIMRNPATGSTSVVPVHGSRPIKKGTLAAILKQLNITIESFVEA